MLKAGLPIQHSNPRLRERTKWLFKHIPHKFNGIKGWVEELVPAGSPRSGILLMRFEEIMSKQYDDAVAFSKKEEALRAKFAESNMTGEDDLSPVTNVKTDPDIFFPN